MTETRALTIYRDTYRVTDDGHGGSVDVDHDIRTDVYPCEGSRGVWVETPAREAVGYLYRENMGPLEGCDWFGYPDPSVSYSDDTQTETTAHLTGPWSDRERLAVARMVDWLSARDDRRAREYASRTTPRNGGHWSACSAGCDDVRCQTIV